MKETNPLENSPQLKTLDEFKTALKVDTKLDEAMQDMEISDANVNREFLKRATPQELTRAYKIVQAHATNIESYKSKYPQRSSAKEWEIYGKAQDQMCAQKKTLMNEFNSITG